MIFDRERPIAARLPGEPARVPPRPPVFVLKLLLRALKLVVLAAVSAPLWPVFLVAAMIWGWPPTVPRRAQVRRYLALIWTVRPPPPGLPVLTRLWLTLSVIRKLLVTPIWGLAWILDEILYADELRDTPVLAPLLEISAARSGSTQLARYLEDDPRLAGPSAAKTMFPYLWMWRLAPKTIGRVFSPEQIRAKIEADMPPGFLERHEGDPFRMDTFEGAFYLHQLNHLAAFLGPEALEDDIGFARIAPHNRALWEVDFLHFLDRVGRKTLIDAGPAPDGGPRRFFVKGHFLLAAPALARRYPDARFLTIIREPGPRLRSAINFLHLNPIDEVLGGVPWPWIAEALSRTEPAYCEVEREWYGREGDGVTRCVIRFSDYVHDLGGTLERIYAECLDGAPVPEDAPREHPPRERTNYSVNRSLEQLGIDREALDERLREYIAWCRGRA